MSDSSSLTFHNDLFKDLFDNASDLIHFATSAGAILYVNPAWEKTLGYSIEELKGKVLYQFISPEERVAFKTFREQLIRNKSHGSITTAFLAKNGDSIIVEASISCKYENGQVLYTRGILRNITARIEHEHKLLFYTDSLRQSQEYVNQLLLNAPDAVIVIDEHSKIIFWNTKSEEIFGWKATEITGKTLGETIIPEQYREAHTRGMQRLLQTGEAKVLNKSIEITALNKNKTEFPISLTISRSKRLEHHVFISFIRDISEQKRKDLELNERRIQLEKSNFELEQYASLTSHDLKEPLRKILLFSDILLNRFSEETPPEISTYIRKIFSIANHMNDLVEAVLHYSVIDQQPVYKEKINLGMVMETVLQNLEIEITDKKARIDFDSLPVIFANQLQMIQLFQNLIGNSIKYSKPGIQPFITVSYAGILNHIDQIIVKDNGIGFENEYAEKIFGIFERLENRSNYPGTGIGLAICRKIVLAHKGSIVAESEPGKGSKFIIELPSQSHPVHIIQTASQVQSKS